VNMIDAEKISACSTEYEVCDSYAIPFIIIVNGGFYNVTWLKFNKKNIIQRQLFKIMTI
jgi:hypothetical protein